MATLGFTPEATRTALHRMAAEGWVAPRRTGRYASYRLTDRGVDRLEEAATRIYRRRAVDWDGQWHLLVADSLRDPELVRALRWMGFGELSPGTWVSPHAHGERLEAVLAAHDATTDLRRFAARFDGEDAEIAAAAWDLGALRDAHAGFIDRWEDATPPVEPGSAFATRITLVHDWRSLLHLDPGLPAPLIPRDTWLGETAAACFRRVYDAVVNPAWVFYDDLTDRAPALQSRSA